MRLGAGLVLTAFLVSAADADPKKAKALNTQGMKKYGKRQYAEALELFKKAIAEDPTYVWPHYNAASMASLVGDFPLVISELEWVAASEDPIAIKAMSGAKADKDLERALMHPRVRELVGVEPLDKLALDKILLERTGTWGADGSYCGMPGYTLTFKKGGAVTARVEAGCNESNVDEKHTGKWKVENGKLVVTIAKAFDGKVQAAFGPCEDKEPAKGWCLIGDDSTNQHRFHRGPAAMF